MPRRTSFLAVYFLGCASLLQIDTQSCWSGFTCRPGMPATIMGLLDVSRQPLRSSQFSAEQCFQRDASTLLFLNLQLRSSHHAKQPLRSTIKCILKTCAAVLSPGRMFATHVHCGFLGHEAIAANITVFPALCISICIDLPSFEMPPLQSLNLKRGNQSGMAHWPCFVTSSLSHPPDLFVASRIIEAPSGP